MEKEPERRSPKTQGEGFKTEDSLSHDFPAINIEKLRNTMEESLEVLGKLGYTGVEGEIEFDEHGLMIGKPRFGSIGNVLLRLKLRSKDDFAILFEKLGEGRNFDSSFSYDPERGTGKITIVLKKHSLVPKLFILEDSEE